MFLEFIRIDTNGFRDVCCEWYYCLIILIVLTPFPCFYSHHIDTGRQMGELDFAYVSPMFWATAVPFIS